MKRSIILLLAMCLVLNAQEWKFKSNSALNLTQNYYNEDWTGSEESNVNWVFSINSSAEKQLTPMINNLNTLKLSYGQINNSYRDINSKVKWERPTKSTDLIDFESVFTFTLGAFVDPYASFRFESQFYDKVIDIDTGEEESKYLNPMTFTESAGVSKTFFKEEKSSLNSRFGLGIRQISDQFNDDTTIDGGLISVTDYTNVILDDKVSFNSKLTLFQAFYNSNEDDYDDDQWKTLDINWENIFTTSITKYLNVNLNFQLKYEEEEVDEWQIKQTLALGLTYNLY